MPGKSSLKRKRATFSSADDTKRNIKLHSPQIKTSRDLERNRHTTRPSIRQTTLTQIEFVQRLDQAASEDSDLDYEEDLAPPIETIEPCSKRRRARHRSTEAKGILSKFELCQQGKKEHNDEKENDVFAIPKDEPSWASQGFTTPRALRFREIPSSQSPTTPLSTRSGRRNAKKFHKSPLKEISVNVKRPIRLEVADTFKTSDTLSSPQSSLSLKLCTNSGHKYNQTPSKTPRLTSSGESGLVKWEILDSDEEISDMEFVSASQLDKGDTIVCNPLSSALTSTDGGSKDPSTSDLEVMKPPISDHSNGGELDCTTSSLHSTENIPLAENDTLEDALLIKPKRTYPGKRRQSREEEVPSSSSLEELPEIGTNRGTSAEADGLTEVSSSPPLAPQPTLPPSNSSQLQQTPRVGSRFTKSPPLRSDSQQVTAQLEQESQWQHALPRPSQATTASMQSSPVRDANTNNRLQLSSSRRAWFFNPLTDSQLLPDSIMNFELPGLTATGGSMTNLVAEDLEEEDEL